MQPGPPGIPLLALTDDGISELRLIGGEKNPRLELAPLVHDPPVMAGTKSFFAALDIVADADGDGRADVFLPTSKGPAVYLVGDQGLADQPISRVDLPGETGRARRGSGADGVTRFFPHPEVRELNGDGLPDLLLRRPSFAGGDVQVFVGSGGGRFAGLRESALDCWDDGTRLRFAEAPGNRPPWPEPISLPFRLRW